jgi:transposase-like protein
VVASACTTGGLACPRCFAQNAKKNGTTGGGKQRDCCLRCGRQFVTRYSYRGRDPAVRRLVVPLALNGCGVRDTARVLGVSPTTVLKLLRGAAARVRRTICLSKSAEMHEAVLKLYIEQHNRQHQI